MVATAKQPEKNGKSEKTEKTEKPISKTALAQREAFWVKIDQVQVDDSTNVRSKESYDSGSARPGEEFASLESLSKSIREIGQLQPCGVVANGDRGYKLVYGFRRFYAAKAAGLDTLFVTPLSKTEAADILSAQLAENEGRKPLNAYEKGHGVTELIKLGYTQTKAAQAVGLSLPSVNNYKAIFDKVSPVILKAWAEKPGTISVKWLLEIRELPVTEQLEKFRALSAGQAPKATTTEGTDKPTDDAEPKEPKVRMAKRSEVQMWLGFVREGRFSSRGPEWVAGVTNALEMVLGEADMPPPDGANPNEAAGDMTKPRKTAKGT